MATLGGIALAGGRTLFCLLSGGVLLDILDLSG
jgi:hypothetical protein